MSLNSHFFTAEYFVLGSHTWVSYARLDFVTVFSFMLNPNGEFEVFIFTFLFICMTVIIISLILLTPIRGVTDFGIRA